MIVDKMELQQQHQQQQQQRRQQQKQQDLKSLVIPWASMVIVAIVATACVVIQNNYHCNDRDNDNEETILFVDQYFEENSSSSSSGILERLLVHTPVEQHHVHKPVYVEEHPSLFPLSTADRLGFFLAVIGLMVAAGGGIGGGGILVPIYILVMGFSPKHGTFAKLRQCEKNRFKDEVSFCVA